MKHLGFARPSLSKLFFSAARWKMGPAWLHQAAARERRRELAVELAARLGHQVLNGPFAGMILPESNSWRDGDFLPKLIGSYEANLRQILATAIARQPANIANAGCAEGYYAVGLARLLPDATVYAFDLDAKARAVCARAAEENRVGDRVVIAGEFTAEHLARLLDRPGRSLLVMDCEGAERELLDPVRTPGLARCDVIVETHGSDITSELKDRFRFSHQIEEIDQGGRNPNEVPALRRLAESDRWLLVDEGRPQSMTWLACWADPAALAPPPGEPAVELR
jgi:hypothetical protein